MKKLPTALTVPSSSLKVWLDDRAAAGGERAGARQIVRRRGVPAVAVARSRCAAWLPRSKIAGVDAVLVEEGFDVDELRLDGVAEHRGLLGDGGAAEKGTPDEQRRQRRGRRSPAAPHAAADKRGRAVGHGVERDAEQHAGEDQEQGVAKYQVNTSSAANSTMPMPPTAIAQARSLRAAMRSLVGADIILHFPAGYGNHSFVKCVPDQAAGPRRFDAGRADVRSDSGTRG